MSLLTILGKGLQAMIDEVNTPESFKIGAAFEQYVRDELFIDRYYDVVDRTHSYLSNREDFVRSSLKPDFTFRDRLTKKEIYVEAKFRTGLYNGKVMWCNENQLVRYHDNAKERPTFLLLGMGEKPSRPNLLALIPISKAKYSGLFPSFVKGFEIKIDTPISSKLLWSKA